MRIDLTYRTRRPSRRSVFVSSSSDCCSYFVCRHCRRRRPSSDSAALATLASAAVASYPSTQLVTLHSALDLTWGPSGRQQASNRLSGQFVFLLGALSGAGPFGLEGLCCERAEYWRTTELLQAGRAGTRHQSGPSRSSSTPAPTCNLRVRNSLTCRFALLNTKLFHSLASYCSRGPQILRPGFYFSFSRQIAGNPLAPSCRSSPFAHACRALILGPACAIPFHQ